MKKKSLLIFAGIVFVGVGILWGVGRALKTRTTLSSETPEKVVTGTPTAAEKAESVTANKVVKHISKSVSGAVKSVSGQTIVLEEDGDTLSVEVASDATITKVTLPSPTALPEELGTAPTREKISLVQIKVGDKVDALLVSQPDGSFLANEVTVLVETE